MQKNSISAFPNISTVKTSIRTFLNLEAKMRLSQKNRTFASLINALTFPNPPCFNNTVCRAGHMSHFFLRVPASCCYTDAWPRGFSIFFMRHRRFASRVLPFSNEGPRSTAAVILHSFLRSSTTFPCGHPPPFVAVMLHTSLRSSSTPPGGRLPPTLLLAVNLPSTSHGWQYQYRSTTTSYHQSNAGVSQEEGWIRRG